jgi:hypothetical protein
MKQVEVEFESNANSTGLQQFRCLKHGVNPQGKNVYLYVRTHAQGHQLGKIFGYEVFIPTITRAGTVQKFPNGITRTVEEDMENYPGASMFGRTAYFCSSMASAEKRFAEMMGQVVEVEEPAEEEKETVAEAPEPPKGKKPDLLIPVGEFTINDLAEHNKISYPTARNGLQFFLQDGEVSLAKEQRVGNAKRATKFFKKTT